MPQTGHCIRPDIAALAHWCADRARQLAGRAFWRVALLAVIATLSAGAVRAQDGGTIAATAEGGFGRMVLSFPGRDDLPTYHLRVENGVLALTFDAPVNLQVPDVVGVLGRYLTVARLDPDNLGIRFGMRGDIDVHPMEAGAQLFLDLLPPGWQGLPPPLPEEVVADLSRRARAAAADAEAKRRAELAEKTKPVATLRVGRNPTFVRLQIDWSEDTEGRFVQDGKRATLAFNWPVPVDLYQIKADRPGEIETISNVVAASETRIELGLADGVAPRFYQLGPRQFVLDIDLPADETAQSGIDPQKLVDDLKKGADAAAGGFEVTGNESGAPAAQQSGMSDQVELTPEVKAVGTTVRVRFPFEADTAAAVFRRGNVVWMFFDTPVTINAPDDTPLLERVAKDFSVSNAGNTQVVRMTLDPERLATLGTQGQAWVLSLGDTLLTPTEPVALTRYLNEAGNYEMTADIGTPGQVHEVLDPDVGDMLSVVTAFPPARGVLRDLDFVDFTALHSVHGLAIKPKRDDLKVALDKAQAIMSAPEGLTLSSLSEGRASDNQTEALLRAGYVDLGAFVEPDPLELSARLERVLARGAMAQQPRLADAARLELARLYLANEMPQESLGVLRLMEQGLASDDLRDDLMITRGAAMVMAHRPEDALGVLNSPDLAEEVDGLMWRSMARAELRDFQGARMDALASEDILKDYPNWVQRDFYFAAATSAIESNDLAMANRMLTAVKPEWLSQEDASRYELLAARIDESENRYDEALDTYGQVIAADMRTTRPEAIYRTIALLDRIDRLDPKRAAETLSQEAMVWRGDELEAMMQALLADLYFRAGDYRAAFETVRQGAEIHVDSVPIADMLTRAQVEFGDLFLNGKADQLDPIDALTLFYDFRHLTPAGARGDEMIRNLARRLVKVDLLAQAADLLRYQIENRLDGAARAQIAADLAVIEIANRAPEAALKALYSTRLSNLPPALDRQRRVLEARALIDAGRDELALDLMSELDGRDVDLLRVDAHWKGKRYREAGELLERLYGSVTEAEPLQQPARLNLIKAAVAFVLADDKIGVSRLRSKFAARLATTPEWGMFDFVTGTVSTSSMEFRRVAREVAGLDSLSAFLAAYSQLYAPEGALAPKTASRADGKA